MNNIKEEYRELHTLTRDIAEALGFDWKYADEQPTHRALLDGPDGMGISVGYKGFDHNRLDIYGRWPEPIRHRDIDTYQFYPRERPVISVAATKTPSNIAKDIQRRLLPEYLVLWQDAVKHKKTKLEELGRIDRILARLVKIPEVKEDKNQNSVRFGKYDTIHGECYVYDNETVSLKIRNLPFEIAIKMLESLYIKGG